MNDWEELAKNLFPPLGMIGLWCYIALALTQIPYPLNYVFAVFIPIISISKLALHYYNKRPQWELDDKTFAERQQNALDFIERERKKTKPLP
jgi:hypothetical protein